MQKWLYIGMMWIWGLCSALSAGQQTQSRFTILGLGDSITEGGDYFTCYLYPLFLYRQPLNETFYEVRRLTDQFLQSVQYLLP